MEIVTLVRDTKKQTTTNQSVAFKKIHTFQDFHLSLFNKKRFVSIAINKHSQYDLPILFILNCISSMAISLFFSPLMFADIWS